MINTVQNIDCLIGLQSIPDKSIDMILCDLPYGTTACKWDTVIPLEPLWEQYERIIKDSGAIVLTASQPFTSALIMSNIKLFKYEWIWVKSKGLGFQHAQNMPMKKHENICVFSKGGMGHKHLLNGRRMEYNPVGVESTGKSMKITGVKHGENLGARPNQVGKLYDVKTNFPNSVLKVASVEDGCHPTQKPVLLFEYLIKTYSNEGETVLDNCMGSGTTAIACLNTNRNYIGFEKDETYFNIIKDRIKKHTVQTELF